MQHGERELLEDEVHATSAPANVSVQADEVQHECLNNDHAVLAEVRVNNHEAVLGECLDHAVLAEVCADNREANVLDECLDHAVLTEVCVNVCEANVTKKRDNDHAELAKVRVQKENCRTNVPGRAHFVKVHF